MASVTSQALSSDSTALVPFGVRALVPLVAAPLVAAEPESVAVASNGNGAWGASTFHNLSNGARASGGGNGWLHMSDSMGRGPGVERCDDCRIFASDDEAQAAHARQCGCGIAQAIRALARVVPYAESRAEDLNEQVEAGVHARAARSEIRDAKAARDRAWRAVEDAKAVLRAAGRLVP